MPPLTLLSVEPKVQLEFPANPHAGTAAMHSTRLRLCNVSGTLVAYKVKSTAPRLFMIKPSTGSIRKGESAEVQIVRKTDVEADSSSSKRPERFLVQAAVVDTEEKKLLLHAAHRGKAQGAARFWDGVNKEQLEERQLEAVFVDGDGVVAESPNTLVGEDADGPKQKGAKGQGASKGAGKGAPYPGQGMPSNEDIDAIMNRVSLPGRAAGSAGEPGKPPPPGEPARPPPPGFAAAPGSPQLRAAAPPGYDERPPPPPEAVPPRRPEPAREPLALRKKEVRRRKEDRVLQKHSRPVTFVCLDPTGKVLFTCGKDKLILAWSCPEGECIRAYEGHRGAVWSCSISPDGLHLLSCGADYMVILWEANSARQLTEVQLPNVARCVEWAPSTRGRCVACSNSAKDKPAAVAVLEFPPPCFKGLAAGDAGGPRVTLTIEEPTLPSVATQVAWAGADTNYIASVHTGGQVIFWDSCTGAMLRSLDAQDGPVSMIAFPRDRSLMASCGRNDMQVRLWDLGIDASPDELKLLQSHLSDRPLNAVALRPSLSRAEVLAAMTGSPGAICDCLIGGGQDARDVALVGAGTDDQFEPLPLRMKEGGELVNWSVGSGGKGGGGHFGPIHTLALSADGGLCISAGEDGNIRIRELVACDGGPSPEPSPQLGPAAPPAQPPPQPMEQRLPPPTQHFQQPATPPPTQPAAQAAARAAAQVSPRQTAPAPAPTAASAGAATAAAQQQAAQAAAAAQAARQGMRMVAVVDFDPASVQWPPSAQHKPLRLQRGEELEVLHDFGSGWAFGRAAMNPAEVGLFPTTFALPLAAYQQACLAAVEEKKAAAQAAQAQAQAAAAASAAAQQKKSSPMMGASSPPFGGPGNRGGLDGAGGLAMGFGNALGGLGPAGGLGGGGGFGATGGLVAGLGAAGSLGAGLGLSGPGGGLGGLGMGSIGGGGQRQAAPSTPGKGDEGEEEGDCSQS